MTIWRRKPWYAAATPSTDTSSPLARIILPAGPLTGASPTMGLTADDARAGSAASASRIPGTARMGPIELMGFDGQTIIASAVAYRFDARQVRGRPGSPPRTRHPRLRACTARARKTLGNASQPVGVFTRVATALIGHRQETAARSPALRVAIR